MPPYLNAAQASSVLGVSYDTFLQALRDPSFPLQASTEEIQRPSGPSVQWQIPRNEIRRLALELNLPLRPWPTEGRKFPQRTTPAAVLGSEALIDRLLADPVEEKTIPIAISALLAELSDNPAHEEGLWRQQLEDWKSSHRGKIGKLPRYDVPFATNVGELLELEASAVRMGVAAATLITALVEARVTPDPNAGKTASFEVPLTLVKAAESCTGLKAQDAVISLLREAIVMDASEY